LSPILGLEGYQTILNEMKTRTYNSSICDWRNWLDDIPALMETGIYGIAVSGLIHNLKNKTETIKQLKCHLWNHQYLK
jgi:thiamine-phosphate pyrophosphorylase